MSELMKTHPDGLFFVTLTVEGWVDVFIRNDYKDLIVENLRYCQQKEGLEIYAYVIMTSHLHMIAARKNGDLGELLGRFKSYTAKKLLKMIETNTEESRKEWMLNLFGWFARKNKQYSAHHFWHYSNHAEGLYSNKFIEQKLKYIHNNPVVAGIVTEPQHYLYSSACPDSPVKVLDL